MIVRSPSTDYNLYVIPWNYEENIAKKKVAEADAVQKPIMEIEKDGIQKKLQAKKYSVADQLDKKKAKHPS